MQSEIQLLSRLARSSARQCQYRPQYRITSHSVSRAFSQSRQLHQEKPVDERAPLPPAPSVKELQAAINRASSSGFGRTIIAQYDSFGSTERLFKQLLRQANYSVPGAQKKPKEAAPKNDAGEDVGVGTGIWFAPKSEGGLGLPVTFNVWAQIMILHMYVLLVRMRGWSDTKLLRIWEQQFLDHFSYAAEDRMENFHGMVARGTRNKHLKDLWQQYRGVILSYDEGLARGDAALAAAVWRSIFRGAEDADISDIAVVVAYLRREVKRLESYSESTVMYGGYQFGDFTDLRAAVPKTE